MPTFSDLVADAKIATVRNKNAPLNVFVNILRDKHDNPVEFVTHFPPSPHFPKGRELRERADTYSSLMKSNSEDWSVWDSLKDKKKVEVKVAVEEPKKEVEISKSAPAPAPAVKK